MNSRAEQVRPADAAATGTASGGTDAGGPADGPWQPVDAIDRSWAAVGYTRSLAGVDVPGAERIREALLEIARQAPEVGRWTTRDQLRWRPVAPDEWDSWLGHVLAVSTEHGAGLDRIATLNGHPPDGAPFRVMVGPDWISSRMMHSVGDGWTVNNFVAELLTRAARTSPDPAPLPWTVLTQRQRDRVIRRDVRAHAGTLLWALRHRGELAGGSYETAGEDVALGREATLELVSEPGLPAALRRLRDELFPGVSAAVVSTVGLRSAVRDAVATPQPGFECLFNTRDESAGTASAWGNFSAGVYLHPADDYDPAATAAEMNRVRSSGLPALAHASLRLRGRRQAGDTVSMPRREGAPRLTISYLQSHNMDLYVPGRRLHETRVGTVTRPNGADSVSMQVIECAGRLHVAVSHFPHVWPTDDVRGAVETFLADPHTLLAPSRRSR